MTHRYLYVTSARGGMCEIVEPALAGCTERHKVDLTVPATMRCWSDVSRELVASDVDGVVLEMVYGWPGRLHLQLARRALRARRCAFFYWPREGAIERVDRERLRSYYRLWAVVRAARAYSNGKHRLKMWLGTHLPASARDAIRPYYHAWRRLPRALFAPNSLASTFNPRQVEREIAHCCLEELGRITARAAPVPLHSERLPSSVDRIGGTGVYLRTDFWAKITSGGSYGHTCFVAKELAAVTERFQCFMAYGYALLDQLGLRQTVMPPPGARSDELTILQGTSHYHGELNALFTQLRPQYIYERLCLGNYTAARLSQELQIPYIAEYNGSEISMMRSFNGSGYTHEDVYLAAEMAAFAQATVISVVSDAVRDDLLRRGVDARKILVNPNGADLETYAPPAPATRAAIRRELGFDADDRVVGFTGTFGGWHGIDILAAAMPRILEAAPQAKFLLIGDGNHKHLVDRAVREHCLHDRVRSVGRVPQWEGARLLGAADVYVSPHNSHMVDSRFFGSPTKIFEYMCMGGGIVASDLEQIGEVLSPALRLERLPSTVNQAGEARALLCPPGDLHAFVAGTIFLLRNPAICAALGQNARRAMEQHYSWTRHVERLWRFVVEHGM